jgi:hypothetical protein
MIAPSWVASSIGCAPAANAGRFRQSLARARRVIAAFKLLQERERQGVFEKLFVCMLRYYDRDEAFSGSGARSIR